jgi:hypothetical protein
MIWLLIKLIELWFESKTTGIENPSVSPLNIYKAYYNPLSSSFFFITRVL